nr:MAG TPA_asm: hypothetical protein [Caudoviricetes sp.]
MPPARRYPSCPRRSVFCLFVQTLVKAGELAHGIDQAAELPGQKHLAGNLNRVFGAVALTQLRAAKIRENGSFHDGAGTQLVGINGILPLAAHLFLPSGCLDEGGVLLLGQGADLERGRLAVLAQKTLGDDDLLFLAGHSGMQKCRKCAHKKYLLKSVAAQVGGVVERFQTLDAGIAEIEIVVQHGFLVIQNGQRDIAGQYAAIVAHYLRAHAGRGVLVGDGDVKQILHAVFDVVQHHIGEQVGAVGAEIDVAGTGLGDTVGLFLHLSGADGLHVRSLNACNGLDVPHTCGFQNAAVPGNGDFALCTVQGVLGHQITHLCTSLRHIQGDIDLVGAAHGLNGQRDEHGILCLACFHNDIRLAVEVLDAAGCLDLIQIFDDGALVLPAAVLGVVHNAHIALGELLIQVVGNGVAQPHGAVVAVHLADLAGIGDQRVDVILHPDRAVVGVEHELACIDGIHILVVGHLGGDIHRIGNGGIRQVVGVGRAGKRTADPPDGFLRGQGGAIVHHQTAAHVDDKSGVRVGGIGFHQLREAAHFSVHALDKGLHCGLYGGILAVVQHGIEVVGLDVRQVGAVCDRVHLAVLAAGKLGADICGQSARAAEIHPAIAGQVCNGLASLLIFHHTVNDRGDLETARRFRQCSDDHHDVVASGAGVFCGSRQRGDGAGGLCAVRSGRAVKQQLGGCCGTVGAAEDHRCKAIVCIGDVVAGVGGQVFPGGDLYHLANGAPAHGFADRHLATITNGKVLLVLGAKFKVNAGPHLVLYSPGSACCHRCHSFQNSFTAASASARV